ncbi:MAG: hypothetical protein F4164_11385 [Gemmatimonadales bacterium]|nr:hypothetical protein [Gemmatimonadales bacterium]MYG49935.1 hypothetical protein [Gemmatimonadales bacterium]MYK01613.1 hypothetical protein [Candidatus Palauibacter ramosifaciens]
MQRSNLPRILAVLFLVLLFVSPRATNAQSACGEYISGGRGYPNSGRLIGYSLVTVTFQGSVGGSAGGVGGSVGGSYTVSFYVGTYDMEEGNDVTLRCDTYAPWLF